MAFVLGVSTASAAPEVGYWKRVNPGNFHAYQWFVGERPGGVATDRFLDEKSFNNMASRLAAGITYPNRGAGYGATEIAKGGSVVTKLRTAATAAGTAATLRQLKGEGLSLMERFKAYGALRLIGDVAMVATAFEVGFKIGSVFADVLGFGGGGESVTEGGTMNLKPKTGRVLSVGDSLCQQSSLGGIVSGPCKLGGPGFFAPVAEVDLLWCQTKSCGETHADVYGPNLTSETKGNWTQILNQLPPSASFVEIGRVELPCGSETCNVAKGIYVMPLEVTALPGDGVSKPTNKTATMPTPETAAESEPQAKECLEGYAGCKLFPGWWWNNDPEVQEATEVEPGAGLHVEPGNPLLVRIPSPGVHESYEAYDAALEKLGLKPEPVALAETAIDPTHGPKEVTTTAPAPNTQVQPESTVRVRYNPANAPESSTGSPWSPPGISSIDLSPLENATPCDVFPFGAACWFVDAIGELGAPAQCPTWTMEFLGGVDDLKGEGQELDLCIVQPVVSGVRPWIYWVGTIFIILTIASWARGGGVPSDNGGGGEAAE